MLKQIFIGGTGRSGTTILGRILFEHKDIFIYPFETRFIVDPYGIIDLCDNLSNKWTPHRGDFAVKKFKKLMYTLYPSKPGYIVRVAIYGLLKKIPPIIAPIEHTFVMGKQWKDQSFYSLFHNPFSPFINKKQYYSLIEEFLNKLVIREMSGYWDATKSFQLKPTIALTKKFEWREICALAGKFVDTLLSIPLPKYKKKIWGDHTPPNILFSEHLVKIFPQSKIIHVYRDFRDVICSYKTKRWGANTTEDAVYSVKYILDKWSYIKRKIPQNRYIEISLEDLVNNTKDTLIEICDFLDVEFDKKMLKVNLSKSHSGRWKKELTENDLKIVEKYLRQYLDEYGYK